MTPKILIVLAAIVLSANGQGNQPSSSHSHPIEITSFLKYIGEKEVDIKHDFESLNPPEKKLQSWDVALKPNNLKKHRYHKEPDLLLTYDHTRVILDLLKNEPDSDFIAANWVDSYEQPKRFIGTQCPMNTTAEDFWRMVWQVEAPQIINLASPHDMDIGKCFKYFPDEDTKFGDVKVKFLSKEQIPDVHVRNYILKKDGEKRPLTHLHFQSWPDLGTPTDPKQLWNLIKRYRSDPLHAEDKPLVVHCVGGVGRTGTFLLTDSMLDMSKKSTQLDFFKHLWTIRNQRISMVEKPEQYLYSHKTVAEALQEPFHPVQKTKFPKYVEKMANVIKMEFESLGRPEIPLKSWEYAKSPLNLQKHRYFKEPDLLLTYDHTRVMLDPIPNKPGSDFIAANWVDSYEHPKRFIGTQCPMNTTADDFWRMVWQYGAQQVVNLASPHDMQIGKCFKYFSDEDKKFGDIHLKFKGIEETKDVHVRKYVLENIRNNEKRDLVHLHFQSWPDLGVPEDPKQLWNLIKAYRMHSLYTKDKPLVVHCVGGVGRTGTFLLTDSMLDMSKKSENLDFFKHLWHIRNQRISMVEKPEQYLYSHKTIVEALKENGATTIVQTSILMTFTSTIYMIYKLLP